MKVTALVEIDLSDFVEPRMGHWIDFYSHPVRERFLVFGMGEDPIHVRINIGTAERVEWPPSLASDLATALSVAVIATHPMTAQRAARDLQAMIAKRSEAA